MKVIKPKDKSFQQMVLDLDTGSSLVIKEMQTIMRYHNTPTRTAET